MGGVSIVAPNVDSLLPRTFDSQNPVKNSIINIALVLNEASNISNDLYEGSGRYKNIFSDHEMITEELIFYYFFIKNSIISLYFENVYA